MVPEQTTYYHTMTSLNKNSLMSLLPDEDRDNAKPAATSFKIVYIGKDKFPFNILKISPIGGEAWRKCFFRKSIIHNSVSVFCK